MAVSEQGLEKISVFGTAFLAISTFLLLCRLQDTEEKRQEAKRKYTEVKQYSSYRALSSSTLFDLELTKSTKALRRSSDNIIYRKSDNKLKSHEFRKSMIGSTISEYSARDSIRTAVSLEHINKKQLKQNEIPLTNIGLTSYKPLDTSTPNNLRSGAGLSNKCKKTSLHDNSERNHKSEIDHIKSETGTLTSDAATMTDNDTWSNRKPRLLPPLHNIRNGIPCSYSQDNIINWLHECDDIPNKELDEENKDTDSDYSSSYYRTSRSSSMTDVTSPMKNNKHGNKFLSKFI